MPFWLQCGKRVRGGQNKCRESSKAIAKAEVGTDEASDEEERAKEKAIQELFRWETPGILVEGPLCRLRMGRTTGTPVCPAQPPGTDAADVA